MSKFIKNIKREFSSFCWVGNEASLLFKKKDVSISKERRRIIKKLIKGKGKNDNEHSHKMWAFHAILV